MAVARVLELLPHWLTWQWCQDMTTAAILRRNPGHQNQKVLLKLVKNHLGNRKQ